MILTNPKKALIRSIESEEIFSGTIRQLKISVLLEGCNNSYIFYWVSAPTIQTSSGNFGNKAPYCFEKFWEELQIKGNLIGRTCSIIFPSDPSYSYAILSKE